MTDHGQELFGLVKAYAKQETVDPLKSIGRFVAFGLGAAVAGGIAVILLLLGVLRALQTETGPHLTGSWTWVPYLVALGLCGVLVLLSVKAIAGSKAHKTGSSKSKKKGAR